MADEKDTALVPHEGESQLPELAATGAVATFDDIMEDAERRAQILHLAQFAVACTGSEHWVDFHGKPYLTSDGAEWIARRVGINYKPDGEMQRQEGWDDGGPYYLYRCQVVAWFPKTGDRIVEIGVCSTRNKFFKKDGKPKPLQNIDEADVMKKAYVNGVARAVRALLGIGALTKEQVESLVGKEAAATVKFKAGKKPDSKKASDKPNPKDEHPNAPPQNAGAPPQTASGRFNKMKAVQELKKYLMDNRVCADIKTYREFVAGVLPPEKCQYDELGEVEVMQGWDKADVESLQDAAHAKVGGEG